MYLQRTTWFYQILILPLSPFSICPCPSPLKAFAHSYSLFIYKNKTPHYTVLMEFRACINPILVVGDCVLSPANLLTRTPHLFIPGQVEFCNLNSNLQITIRRQFDTKLSHLPYQIRSDATRSTPSCPAESHSVSRVGRTNGRKEGEEFACYVQILYLSDCETPISSNLRLLRLRSATSERYPTKENRGVEIPE